MKKILSIFLCALMMLSVIPVTSIGDINVSAAEGNVVFLRNGGDNSKDGSNYDNAVSSIHTAYKLLKLKNSKTPENTNTVGTIVICGEFKWTGADVNPIASSNIASTGYEGTVTLTSVYGGVDYRSTKNAKIIAGTQYDAKTESVGFKNRTFLCAGDTVFENITFSIFSGVNVVGQGHSVTIGSGVTVEKYSAVDYSALSDKQKADLESKLFDGKSADKALGIIGGWLLGKGLVPAEAGGVLPECNVTVRSGSGIIVYGLHRNYVGNVGNSNITIVGDADVSAVYVGATNAVGSKNGNVILNIGCEETDGKIVVSGDPSIDLVNGSTQASDTDSLTINWYNGDVKNNISVKGSAGKENHYDYTSLNFSDYVILKHKVATSLVNGVSQSANKEYFINVSTSTVPTLLNAGLTLDGKIGVNFALEMPEDLRSEAAITTAVGDDVVEQEVVWNGDTCEFSHYVAAKQMADEITITYSAKTWDTKATTVEYTYSVKEYADTIIANEGGAFSPELVALAEAMLTYGAYTQQYADYNTEKLATATPNDVSTVSVDDENKVTKASNANIGSVEGASLVLLEDTTFKVFVRLNTGVNVNDLEFTVDGNPVEAVESGEYYVVAIEGINAGDLSKKYNVKVAKSTDEISFVANPLSYCYVALKPESSDELKNLVRALVAYDKAASDYAN